MATLCSYAGVTIPVTPPETEGWWDAVHPRDLFKEWSGWNFAGFDLQNLPTPAWPEAPRFQVGVLSWPTGAVRPAWFHFACKQATLDAIRAAVSDPVTPQDLTLFDGRPGKTVTAKLYMLPPRPVAQFAIPWPGRADDLWLVTLTDVRFFFQWRRSNVVSRPSSWASLYANLAADLGVTLTPEAVHSAYGVPSRKWIGYDRPAAAVLDAVAETVGQRVVANLDGTFKTVSATTAKAASAALVAGKAAASVSGVSPRWLAGGLVDEADVARYVPASVNTLFASGYVNVTPAAPYTVNNTLASLAIAEYGSSTGVAGAAGSVYADTAFDGTNAAACAAYAQRAATDWYGWRLPDADFVWPLVEPWVPTGWEDCVEWTWQKRADQPFASTAVRRGEWDDFVSGSWYSTETDWPQLGRVLSSAGNAHTVRRYTRDGSNAPVAYSPTEDYANVLNPLLASWPVNTYVEFWPIWDQPDYYWGHQLADASGSGITGFHARLISGSGVGPWSAQPLCASGGTFVDSGDPVYPVYALPQEDAWTPRPDVDDNVWVKQSQCGSGYEFIADPKFGCGISYALPQNEYVLDLDGVAGPGLYWDATGCSLETLIDCGLQYVTTADGEAVAVNASALALPSATTGLVVVGSASGGSGCAIGVDRECASTVDEILLLGDPEPLLRVGPGGVVELVTVRQTFTNCFNAAGVLVNRTPGAQEELVTQIDGCLIAACCEATELTVVAAADPVEGCVSLEVDFTATPSGGVSPYTYLWDFDDGTTSTAQNPTHTFTVAGTYEVVVTVTDACGSTAIDSVTVTVDACDPVETICCPDDPVPFVLYAHVLSGTFAGDYVMFGAGDNVTWNFTLESGAFGTCPQGGVYAPITLKCNEAGSWELYTDDLAFGPFAAASVACDPFEVTFNGVSWSGDCGADSGITVTVNATP